MKWLLIGGASGLHEEPVAVSSELVDIAAKLSKRRFQRHHNLQNSKKCHLAVYHPPRMWYVRQPTVSAFGGRRIMTAAMRQSMAEWVEQEGISAPSGWALCYNSPAGDSKAPKVRHSLSFREPCTIVQHCSRAKQIPRTRHSLMTSSLGESRAKTILSWDFVFVLKCSKCTLVTAQSIRTRSR